MKAIITTLSFIVLASANLMASQYQYCASVDSRFTISGFRSIHNGGMTEALVTKDKNSRMGGKILIGCRKGNRNGAYKLLCLGKGELSDYPEGSIDLRVNILNGQNAGFITISRKGRLTLKQIIPVFCKDKKRAPMHVSKVASGCYWHPRCYYPDGTRK